MRFLHFSFEPQAHGEFHRDLRQCNVVNRIKHAREMAARFQTEKPLAGAVMNDEMPGVKTRQDDSPVCAREVDRGVRGRARFAEPRQCFVR